MPQINIRGTIIDFPDSAESPNWAPAVIQFAEEVAAALDLIIGPFDVAPQVLNIDAYNPGVNVNLPNLAFSTTQVRGAIVNYSVFRQTDSNKAAESGLFIIVYNPDGPVNNKWAIAQQKVNDASISFSITDNGQFQFTTTSIAGLNHTGRVTYYAKALEQE